MAGTFEGPRPHLDAIRQRGRQAWASGDITVDAVRMELVGELLCDAAHLRGG